MAEWLNTAFAVFDGGVFGAMHNFAKSAGGFFTPFFKVVSVFGEKGLFFIIVSLILSCFRKTRKTGLTMLFSIGVGALFTNIIIKNVVARPRPYTNPEYTGYWLFTGGVLESEYSFPSGHTTATMASMTALFICCNKKWSWTGFIFALLMATSRVYLTVHYTTDVIAGLIVGGVAGVLGFVIVKFIYKFMNKFSENKICNFVLNSCVLNLFKKKETVSETVVEDKKEIEETKETPEDKE